MIKPYSRAEVIFDIIKEIGFDGRNSRVYIIKDHQLNAEVVAKQILKSSISDPDQFFEESRALYSSAHPNVVQIHYACADADHIYLAMPYYRNGSIAELITGKNMTVREIVRAGCHLLSGLHNIHSKRLIHFDIKPDNILLSSRGEALVSDFGQAKPMNQGGIAEQDRLYAATIPPEVFVDGPYDLTFDIYQVGLTLYRMCNGNETFYSQLQKYGRPMTDRTGFKFDVCNGRFPDRKIFAEHIPSKLRKIVCKCLEVKAGDRFQSALELSNALADVDGPTLDWRLVKGVNEKTWTKSKEDAEYKFCVRADGTSELRKTVGGGASRRVVEGCKSNIREVEIKDILGSY